MPAWSVRVGLATGLGLALPGCTAPPDPDPAPRVLAEPWELPEQPPTATPTIGPIRPAPGSASSWQRFLAWVARVGL